MLSLVRIPSSNYGEYLSNDEYYRGGGVSPAEWFGEGARLLGLEGAVQSEDFQAIFNGFSPDGRRLIKNAGNKKHRPGWDLTFSAPKSVSVLWAIADEATRAKIEWCHEQAVKEALRLVELEAGWSRKGKGGGILLRASLAFSLFSHGTSRALDPNYHTHCPVPNVAVCEDGVTRTVHSRPIFRWKMTLGAIYRNSFANLLQTALGLRLVKTLHGFEIGEIPNRVNVECSKRRRDIEAELSRTGRFSAKAAEVAALKTRQPKQELPTHGLHDAWRAIISRLGFSPEQANNLINQAEPRLLPAATLTNHIQQTINEITQSQAHFTKREILRDLATGLVCQGISSEQLIAAVEQYLHRSHDIIHLQELDCERQFTTQRVMTLEAELQSQCDRLSSQNSFGIAAKTVENVLASFRGVAERPQQAKALEYLCSSGALKLLSGIAGAGKTKVLDAFREACEREGYNVVGAALAGRAARELESKAHIKSDTIAKWLHSLDATPVDALKHHAQQVCRAANGRHTFAWEGLSLDAKSILVIDEMGMVDTVLAHRTISHALAAGAKVVLVGDPYQLAPIGMGAPFRALLARHPSVQLQTVERQSDLRDRKVVEALACGDVRAAFRSYQERGLITVENNRKKAAEQLIRDWSNYGGVTRPDLHSILVCTNADRLHLNGLCQQARRQAGQISHASCLTIRKKQWVEGLGTVVTREDIHAGDRIMALERSRAFGLENGDIATVKTYDCERRMLTLELDRPGTRPKLVEIPDKHYSAFTLAYAGTVHKFQGADLHNAYVLFGGSMQSREMTYTQFSRAINTTRVYVDELEAGQNFDRMIDQMERSQAKLLAHELLPLDGASLSPRSDFRSAMQDPATSTHSQEPHHEYSLRPYFG